jgi:hypothetical protein
MPSTLNDDEEKRYIDEKTEKRHQSQSNVGGELLINLGSSIIQEICKQLGDLQSDNGWGRCASKEEPPPGSLTQAECSGKIAIYTSNNISDEST